VLHAIRSDSGEHRSYRVDKIQGAVVTNQSFTPRYLVELSPLFVERRTGGFSFSRARIVSTTYQKPILSFEAQSLREAK